MKFLELVQCKSFGFQRPNELYFSFTALELNLQALQLSKHSRQQSWNRPKQIFESTVPMFYCPRAVSIYPPEVA
jgi:hypothetical protein